ncbi:MAG: TIGR04282 family arsenosugar biosynthesis glycosyltransferase [Cyanobacteria bacterium P01_C01_bin.72]
MSKTLIIFSRYPEPGKTKTRMIPALGAAGAAELQRGMTEHTLKTAIALSASVQVETEVHFAGGNLELMQQWLGQDVVHVPQTGGDLGAKMCSAFARAFASGSQQVVIIGIDCPDIDCQILTQAFESLEAGDLVLGVAEDGGYYLIGLNRPIEALFEGVSWGTEQVLNQTQAIAERLQLKIDYLTPLADVDRPEDLRIWQKYAQP